MLYDANGNILTIKKPVNEQRAMQHDAYNMPNGMLVSVKHFLKFAKTIEDNEAVRTKLEIVEKITGCRIMALAYNRANEFDKRKILRNLEFGEKINRHRAKTEDGLNATSKGYAKLDAALCAAA